MPAITNFNAIWDTGATNCAISQRVVDDCGLVPTGMAIVHGVGGAERAEVYLVNIYLPNNLAVFNAGATKATLLNADILIGMNIISLGDFAVTNKDGHTKFSFRVPSQTHIDFVEEHNAALKMAAKRKRKKGQRRKKPKQFGRNKHRKMDFS